MVTGLPHEIEGTIQTQIGGGAGGRHFSGVLGPSRIS